MNNVGNGNAAFLLNHSVINGITGWIKRKVGHFRQFTINKTFNLKSTRQRLQKLLEKSSYKEIIFIRSRASHQCGPDSIPVGKSGQITCTTT